VSSFLVWRFQVVCVWGLDSVMSLQHSMVVLRLSMGYGSTVC
jgi:hypothetical protein